MYPRDPKLNYSDDSVEALSTKPNVNLTVGIRERIKQVTLGVFHILL